jgi:hypothetical protein
MDNLFQYNNEKIEKVDKINLDELYARKQEVDKQKMYTYNKILTRIHEKIKLTSRQKYNQHFCWYIVPEIMLGVANYDHAECIAYIVEKLQENKFMVRYTHPNLLLISWLHYVPNYVRSEFKKKTGMTMDEFGRPVEQNGSNSNSGNIDGKVIHIGSNTGGERNRNEDLNSLLYNSAKIGEPNTSQQNQQNGNAPPKKEYTPIHQYKPTGNLVYNEEYFKKIENRFTS